MPFPESPRVIYERNPLREVICQVRFPPILRIETEPPAAFQDRVRAEYPMFREVQPELPTTNMPAEMVSIFRSMLSTRARSTAYEFASEDGAWSITLSRDAVALKTTAYGRWEDFRDHLDGPLRSLSELYKPALFSRVGLRYVDVIQRSMLGLMDRPWLELLKPHIAGEFAATELADQIEHAARELRIRLADEGSVMIRHGIAVDEGANEQCFVIDSDFFTERRLEPQNALERLGSFNRNSGRLFRWCIQETLHSAMRPTVVDE